MNFVAQSNGSVVLLFLAYSNVYEFLYLALHVLTLIRWSLKTSVIDAVITI